MHFSTKHIKTNTNMEYMVPLFRESLTGFANAYKYSFRIGRVYLDLVKTNIDPYFIQYMVWGDIVAPQTSLFFIGALQIKCMNDIFVSIEFPIPESGSNSKFNDNLKIFLFDCLHCANVPVWILDFDWIDATHKYTHLFIHYPHPLPMGSNRKQRKNFFFHFDRPCSHFLDNLFFKALFFLCV